ncbi:MAG: hypothetical protein ASARMPREDX12_007863 [Alectoria sarmentosa]|nr:MAG: hypothetical protein ASARMPRED_002908 [Alectoria sarmentosa]CAD6576376.1 MAG: hypothetical protein ASARMPREDX12_007863 [Alectoria sarmentosa]
MGKAFFTSWVLWEKMVFVLGASILLVIILGLMKLTYNKWRLRKYTAIAETKAALRQEMQHTASVKRGRSQRQKIPFGVRALESGIEVDGVWISGTNTPTSMPGSPNVAAMRPQPAHRDLSPDASSSASEVSRIEIPQPVHGYPGMSNSAGPSSKIPRSFDRPISSERQHGKLPTSDHQSGGRPTYQPRRSSQLRFSNSLNPEESQAFATLEGRSMTADRNGKRPEGSDSSGEEYRDSTSWPGHSKNSSGSENHSDSNQPIQSKRSSSSHLHPASRQPPKIRTSKTYNPDRYKPVQLDPLASNTESYMDELGRLHVRNRESGMIVVYAPVEDSVSRRLASSQDSNREASDPFVTPETSPKEDRIPVMVDAPPANQHSEMIGNGDIDYIQGHAQPLRPFDGNRQLRRSQVVRKVNSGFEVLRPGTLDTPRRSSDTADAREDYNRKSKKLQRRSRASSGSNFIENV